MQNAGNSSLYVSSESRDLCCLYVLSDLEGYFIIVAAYVDDIILGGRSESKLNEVKRGLSKQFNMKDLGPLHHFVVVTINQDSRDKNIWIKQHLLRSCLNVSA